MESKLKQTWDAITHKDYQVLECREIGTHTMMWENKLVYSSLENDLAIFRKVEVIVTLWFSKCTLGIHPGETIFKKVYSSIVHDSSEGENNPNPSTIEEDNRLFWWMAL